jgi:hypothetical protein
MVKSISVAVVCCLAALVAADRMAFGQAGSTGGTLGKTDKSASGGEESGPHQTSRPRGARKANQKSTSGSCQRIVGSWSWHGGAQTVFNADGTGRNSAITGTTTCTWKCVDGVVVANWGSLGIVDRITISGDGNSEVDPMRETTWTCLLIGFLAAPFSA